MKIKNRLLSGLLSFVMTVSLLPAMSFVPDTQVQAETIKNPEIYVYPKQLLGKKGYQEVGKASCFTVIWWF